MFHLSSPLLSSPLFTSTSGWLLESIKRSDNLKSRLNFFDVEFVNAVNAMIKAVGMDVDLLLRKKDYDVAIDIKRSLEGMQSPSQSPSLIT